MQVIMLYDLKQTESVISREIYRYRTPQVEHQTYSGIALHVKTLGKPVVIVKTGIFITGILHPMIIKFCHTKETHFFLLVNHRL